MAAATSPALPAFSYAQAAKGLAPATPATHSQAESSPNTSDLSSSKERKSSTPGSEKLDPLHNAAVVGKEDEASNDVVPKAVHEEVDAVSLAKPNPDKTVSSTTKQTSSS